ncbi:MAG: 50S ribosomal protein L32 [Candidatus Omnitrophica bacterium CG11_big_fil_rev_8_21_14_0_20_64_10]|nr:MAG: 50S ribosomal protein L32 [Candidatus Omnitrophica bacterium CG11_big_fil_rev_8_21_14_0_20_64_10]
MGLPKRRFSKARTGKRRTQLKLRMPTLVRDPQTGELKRPHHIGPDGSYRGRQVLPKREAEAGSKKKKRASAGASG